MSKFEPSLTHDALARSLADSLRNERTMTWCDVQLGPAPSPRPDVYTIAKSFAHPAPTSYECKVSQSDFRSDVTTGKWQAYLKFSCAVYFACEEGLLSKELIPNHCGLIVRYRESGTWRRVKRAVSSPVEIPQHVLLKLLIDGVEREGPKYRARSYEYTWHEKLRKKLGQDIADAVRDLDGVQSKIAYLQEQAGGIIERAESAAKGIREQANVNPLRDELCDVLKLERTASPRAIERAIAEMRRNLEEHPAARAHREMTEALQRELRWHGYKTPVEVEG